MAMAMAMAMAMGKGKAAGDLYGFSYSQTRLFSSLSIQDKAAGDNCRLDVGFPQQRNISRIINHTSTMSWANLPVDILFIIFGFFHKTNDFNIIDLYQCLAVCRSWRFVAKQIWKNCILPTTPWFASNTVAPETLFFHTNLQKCHKHPPSFDSKNINPSFLFTLDLHHLNAYASYGGWLLVGDSDNLPFLYNPITLVLFELPPLPEHRLLHFDMKFVSSGASPTDHDYIICLNFSEKRGMKNLCNLFFFCRPASSTSWVVLPDLAEDFIFNGGKFYTIGSGGDLFVYNSEVINGNSSGQPWKEMKIADAVYRNSRSWCNCFFYLLESKHRDLLMVMRTVEVENMSTTSFRIFKLNRSYDSRRNYYCHYYWKEISYLPEKESIILLWNGGMTISVADHNGYNSNCIYFYDENYACQITTYGIYDLGNRKINLKSADQDSGHADLYNFKLFTPCKISDI